MKKLLLLISVASGIALAQSPTITAVVSTEAGTSTVLCPGLLVSIYGTGFGTGSTSSVVVLVGTQNAYVIAVSAGQLSVQLPFNAPIGPATVTVTTGAGTSAPFDVTISAVAPTLPLFPQSTNLGVFANATGYLSTSNLGHPGDNLVVYAVGLGATNPVIPAGPTPSSPLVSTATVPTLTVGGVPATVSFAGLAPGLAGLYQLNFVVPATAQGSEPVVLSIDGQTSNSVTLPLFGISTVVNGGSFLNTGTAAPEEIITIYANGLGSTEQINTFPTTVVDGVSVTFNGTAAPIFDLVPSQGQINLIVPADLPTSGTVQVQLTTATGTSLNFPLVMSSAVPGIFPITDPSNPKAQIAAAEFANTAWLVVPNSTATALQIPQNCTASMANPLSICGQPAAPGDTLSLFTTGLGLATPNGDPSGTPLATGQIAPANGSVIYETVATPTVQVGGVTVPILFSGIAPGTAGEYQVNFQVPMTGVTEGDAVPLTISMPGSTTAASTIAVHSR